MAIPCPPGLAQRRDAYLQRHPDPNDDVGAITVKVAADDGHGGTASDAFVLTVTNANDAPTVDQPLVDQAATEDQAFSYQFADDTFSDVDADDTLTYLATLDNGDPLPAWLSFSAATRTSAAPRPTMTWVRLP